MMTLLWLVLSLPAAYADPRDPVAELSSFCQNGDSSSCLMLAVRGRQAQSFYRQGCEMGDPLGCMRLGAAFEPNQGQRARRRVVELQQAGCTEGHVELCGAAGMSFLDRRSPAPHDAEKGVQLLTAACLGGDMNACSLVEALEPKEVRVSRERVEVDGKVAATVELRGGQPVLRVDDLEGGQVTALKQALEPASGWLRQTTQALGGSTTGVSGQVRLVTAADVPFSVLEPVLLTLEASGFRDVRVVVSSPEGDAVADLSLPVGLALRSLPPPNAEMVERENIRAVMLGQSRAFRRCYELRLLHDPKLQGRLLIDFTIQPDGSAAELHTAVNTLSDPEVASCVEEQIRGLTFPRPADKQPIPISYPFTFSP